MNLVADEGVDAPIVAALRGDGHRVAYVAETKEGLADEGVLDHANHTQSLLVTSDKDFGELVFRQGRVTHGVVLLRLSGLSPRLKGSIVRDAMRRHGAEMRHAFAVVSPGVVRIRRKV